MRLRSVLQTMDSSRFHQDRNEDRLVDVAHARSELLTSMLFGFDVVVPANDIADSPAFVTLFTEVFGLNQSKFDEAEKRLGHSYRPFRAGLEESFFSKYGYAGYAAYAANYRQREVDRAARGEVPMRSLTELGELGEEVQLSRAETIHGMVGALLSEDSDYIAPLTRSKRSPIAYAKLVRRYFVERSSPASRSDFYAEGDPFAPTMEGRFAEFIRASCAEGSARTLDEDRKVRIMDAVVKLRSSDRSTASRAEWLAAAPSFFKPEDLPLVRDWLDAALFQLVFEAFGAAFRTYFTQECGPDPHDNQFRMGMLRRPSYERFERAAQGQGSILPASEKISWAHVIDIVSDADFQRSLNMTHRKIGTALRQSKDERGEAIRDALDEHLLHLGGVQDSFRLRRRGERIVLDRQPQPFAATPVALATGAAVTGSQNVLSFLNDAAGGPLANSSLTATAAMGATTVAVPLLAYAVDKLRRSSDPAGFAKLKDGAATAVNWSIDAEIGNETQSILRDDRAV